MTAYGEWGNRISRHPKAPLPIVTKICVGDYVGDIYQRAKFCTDLKRGFISEHVQFCAPICLYT